MSKFCPYTYKSYPAGLKYPWTYPMPSEKERDKRWEVIRKSMKKNNLDCLIVGAPNGFMPASNHIYYISNYMPFYNLGTYVVFPLEGEAQLGVDNGIGPQFLHCAVETSWIREIADSFYPIQDVVHKVQRLKMEKGTLGVVGYRGGLFAASAYDALRAGLPDATLVDGTMALVTAMDEVSRTSTEELAFLKKACELQDLSYEAVAKALKPGVKEYELWAEAEYAIMKNGGWCAQFIIGTSGPAPTFPRAPASFHALSAGDLVMFEISPTYGGVSPQIHFSLSLGEPKKEIVKMFDICEELYHYSLAELEKNRTFLDIELDLAERIHDAGYEPMTPQLHRYNMSMTMPMKSVPQPGDYFTVHPNFCNRDYTAGAKIGDTVRINKNGKVERLQRTPVKLNII